MKIKETVYNEPTKQILAIPDHYVALAQMHLQASSEEAGLAVLENGRYIVKAGTIYPSNDADAEGVILNDYDVTDGDAHMAVVYHGFVKQEALPEEPTALAVTALPMIKFVQKVE